MKNSMTSEFITTYPEVIGIHMQLLRVHDAQLGIGILDVVHVLHCSFQSTHHSFSMLSHFGISDNGSVGGQVSEGSKMSLSPGIHNQKPGSRDTC